jgi:hypothetical protein
VKIIKEGQFCFLIPDKPKRYRANCSKEGGCFVDADRVTTKGATMQELREQGALKGNFVELAIVKISPKILTFEPHYDQEHFTEIWGIPTAGELRISEKGSQLITFLLHRQSKDALLTIGNLFAEAAFIEAVTIGAETEEEIQALAIEKAKLAIQTHIFRFEFMPAISSNGERYHHVACNFRKPESEMDLSALMVASKLTEYCIDPAIESNHQNNMLALAPAQEAKAIEPDTAKKRR